MSTTDATCFGTIGTRGLINFRFELNDGVKAITHFCGWFSKCIYYCKSSKLSSIKDGITNIFFPELNAIVMGF
jgi:hypothetical protein